MRLQRKTPPKTLHEKLSGKAPYGKRPPRVCLFRMS